MNKAISFAILYVSLFLIEILIMFILLILVDIPQYGIDKFFINRAWNGTGLWNLWRICYYGLPLVIMFFLLFKQMNVVGIFYKPFLFSFFNMAIFIALNLFYKSVDLPNLEFTNSLFWITCVAIFLSPLILGQVPYFKKLMENL